MAGPQRNVRIVVSGSALATGEARTKIIQNVYDFYRTTAGGSPNKTNIKAAFKTSILTPLGACLSVSYVKNTIDVRFIDDATDPFQRFTDGVNGGVTGDSLPSLNNVTMQLVTGLRGGSFRGYKHYGPIAESHTALDYLNSTAIALWATYQTAFVAGFTDSDGFLWKPVVVSALLSDLIGPPVTVTSNFVTSTIVNAPLGRMKNRGQTSRSAA